MCIGGDMFNNLSSLNKMKREDILQAIKKVLNVDRLSEGDKISLLNYDVLDFMETVFLLEGMYKITYLDSFLKFHSKSFTTFKEVINHLMETERWMDSNKPL